MTTAPRPVKWIFNPYALVFSQEQYVTQSFFTLITNIDGPTTRHPNSAV
jgi:hypothetical protein